MYAPISSICQCILFPDGLECHDVESNNARPSLWRLVQPVPMASNEFMLADLTFGGSLLPSRTRQKSRRQWKMGQTPWILMLLRSAANRDSSPTCPHMCALRRSAIGIRAYVPVFPCGVPYRIGRGALGSEADELWSLKEESRVLSPTCA